MAEQGPTRDGIERAAAKLREAQGGRISHEQARERVESAVRQGDRKRENGGR